MGLIAILLLALCLWLLWRYLRAARLVSQMAEAAKEQRPFLISQRSFMPLEARLENFQEVVNRFIYESRAARKKQEGQLGQLDAALRNIKEAIIIVDEENRIVMSNQSLNDRFNGGRRVEEGRHLGGVILNTAFLDFASHFKKSGNPGPVEIEFAPGNLWFEVSGAALPAEISQDRPLHLFILRDITEQKKLETMRSEFVANASHELRTPTTIIKGFVDTLLEDHARLTEKERENFLQTIQKNVVRLHHLLEDLLTLSRMETPGYPMNFEIFSLGEVVREICANYESRMRAQAQKLIIDADTSGDWVKIDKLRFTQVVENLLENAVRHAKGMTELRVTAKVAGDKAICTIADNGQGIPQKHLPHLFERFYRVDKGRARESGGTGLGLSIVKHIIQQLGGTVLIDSKEGAGTTVTVMLPLLPEEKEGN